jgi:hypothetical protein
VLKICAGNTHILYDPIIINTGGDARLYESNVYKTIALAIKEALLILQETIMPLSCSWRRISIFLITGFLLAGRLHYPAEMAVNPDVSSRATLLENWSLLLMV